jgi:hypothetical protein
VYINETIPLPPPLCDAVGGALITLFCECETLPEAGNNNYLGSECDHLPEAGNNNYLGSECDHLPEASNIYIGIHPMRSARPYLRLLIVGAAEGGERRQTNTPKAY